MHNIEKRQHAGPSRYRGYGSNGHIYRIHKSNDRPGAVWWCAVCIDGTDVFHARTLRDISRKLESRP